MFSITTASVMESTGAHKNSLTSWLRDLPYTRAGVGGIYIRRYRPDDVVTALRTRRRGGLEGDALRAIVSAFPADDLGAPLDDADSRAAVLLTTFTAEERERFARVTKWAGEGAAYAMWDKTHLFDVGRALGLLVLRPAVLTYILTAQRRRDLPTTREGWGDYAAQHVISTATPDELRRLANNGAVIK